MNFCNFTSCAENLNISFDVIGLTETWLNEANANLYDMKGYVQRESCREGSRGGGVSLNIKEDLSFNVRNYLTVSNYEFESIYRLKNANNHSNKLLIGVVYNPFLTILLVFLILFKTNTKKLTLWGISAQIYFGIKPTDQRPHLLIHY